jgi:homoserine/homoserine lactone efflux protein
MPTDASTLAIYLFATLLMCLSPGPNVMLMISLGLRDGSATVLRAVAGIGVASLLFLTVSALGVAAALHASETLFAIVRYAGAAYLVYLGVRLLIAGVKAGRVADEPGPDRASGASGASRSSATASAPATANRGAFWQGFVTHLSNPKAVLYWTALLPQFVDPARPIAAQTVTLGLIGIAMDLCILAGYGFAAAGTRHLGVTARYTRWIDLAAGTFFVVAGSMLALSHRT